VGGLSRTKQKRNLPPVFGMHPAARIVGVPPRPGDPYASAFVVEPMNCWRMVYDAGLQADRRRGPGGGLARQVPAGGGSGRAPTISTG
jgi:hypothetical protein